MNRLYRVGIIKFPCGIVFMTLVTATHCFHRLNSNYCGKNTATTE